MAKHLHIDFETRSAVNIRQAGSDIYSKHPTTSIMCMAWGFDDDPIEIWVPGNPFPKKVLAHVASGGTVIGHNIGGFELLIWNNIGLFHHGWPLLELKNCEDTMALGYAMGLPGTLDGLNASLGLDHRKDLKGHRIMLQLSQPRAIQKDGSIIWWEPDEFPEKFEKLYSYCIDDVAAEREAHKRLMRLSKNEAKLWHLDWHINRRGVNVDVKAAKAALEIVAHEKKLLDERMKQITQGMVGTCMATGQLTDFLKSLGLDVPSVAKADVLEMLERPELPDGARQALLLRQEAAKTSTAKLNAMLRGLDIDHRNRGLFQYHGATTGRWAGRRVQLQNLPRPKLKQEKIEEAFEIFHSPYSAARKSEKIVNSIGRPLPVISDCIRGFLCAREDWEFIACDFSAIESRVLAWLSGEDKKLKAFATHGKIYEMVAAQIFNTTIDKVTDGQRQIGKVAELACGYGGGVGALQQMSKGYNVEMTDVEAERYKQGWRNGHQKTQHYWYALNDAAYAAIKYPAKSFKVGPQGREVTYKKSGSFLWCLLPSGRVICYPYPRIENLPTRWGTNKDTITYMTMVLGKWRRTKTYGGKLSENVTQAVARCLLADAMNKVEAAGYPIVMHVHDEIVCEVPKAFGSLDEIKRIMGRAPSWAEALPLDANGWRGSRFRK